MAQLNNNGEGDDIFDLEDTSSIAQHEGIDIYEGKEGGEESGLCLDAADLSELKRRAQAATELTGFSIENTQSHCVISNEDVAVQIPWTYLNFVAASGTWTLPQCDLVRDLHAALYASEHERGEELREGVVATIRVPSVAA